MEVEVEVEVKVEVITEVPVGLHGLPICACIQMRSCSLKQALSLHRFILFPVVGE